MSEFKVRDLMLPISDYATVSEDATLFDAIIALEKSQEKMTSSRYRHRAILVLDAANNVVGKVSMISILKALEPKYAQMGDVDHISRSGMSTDFLKSMIREYSLWEQPLEEVCRKANDQFIKTFMTTPVQGELVDEDAELNAAIHLLVTGNLQSLLVTAEKKITGILRLTDIFHHICETAKQCKA